MDYPILLTPDGKHEAILHRAYNIIVEDELLTTSNGYETLKFNMSNRDRKRSLLSNERLIKVQGREYIIRLIEDVKNNSNVCTVTCDATWYDLNDGELKRLMAREAEVVGKYLKVSTAVDIFNEASVDAQVVGSLEVGVSAELLEEKAVDEVTWYLVKSETVVGWVYAQDGFVVETVESIPSISVEESIAQQLEGTDWTIGTVDVEGTRPGHTSAEVQTSLYNLRQISDNFGGDLFFDTVEHTVNLLSNMGVRHQKMFRYEKNTTSIKRTVDTRNLFTRYTLIGKDADGNDVTVADINDGKDYVENFEWYDWSGLPRKLKWYTKTDNRWSNKENMLEHMKAWLKIYSKPIVGYELNVSLFEISPNLGDYVYVMDTDLGISDWLRVVSRKKNILEPHSSTVQLEFVKRTIVESMTSTTATAQQTQHIVSGVITPDMELKLPAGTEDWVMQYKNGEWRASNILGDINAVLDAINGEVI